MNCINSPRRKFKFKNYAVILGIASTLFICGCHSTYIAQPPNFVDVIDQSSQSIVAISDEKGFHGSGFRLANSRKIITAAHVVKNMQPYKFVVWHGQRWPVKLIRSEADIDLALLELESDAPIPGMLISAQEQPTKAGEWIVVLGCPFGTRPTATIGIVSAEPGAVLEPAELSKRMQLNAAINPGNSGGPVVTLDSKVIGVANAAIPGGFGLGFAIPVSELANFLKEKDREP